jgi:putative endopeptidase
MNMQILKWLGPSLLLFACNHPAPEPKPDFLAANIDSSVSPAQDFFLYANGGWIKRTPIPDAESRWDIGNLVGEEIYIRLKKINQDAEKENAPEGSTSQKIRDFWYSGMDSLDIEKNGLVPLNLYMEKIRGIKTKEDLVAVTADLHNIGIHALFADYVGQDDKNSEEMAYHLNQGGLGMPNREYYFNTDERTQGVRKAYTEYLNKVFRQLGSDSATATRKSGAVYQLETHLAQESRELAALRDPYKNYDKMNLIKLGELSQEFNWPSYLHKIGILKLDSVIVGQPEFYAALSKQIKNTGKLERLSANSFDYGKRALPG